jgi:hypothetical protein
MRTVLSAVLFVHGIAHIVGFVVPWKLITSPDVPYRTTVLTGSLDLGPAGVRLLGIVWLVVALLFIVLAVSVQQHAVWWYEDAFVLVGVSLMLCLLGWPEARPGMIANAVIVGLMLVGRSLGWYPEATGWL